MGHLGEAKRLKREDPGRVVGVGGCWSQSMKERVFEMFPFVDVAFGPGQVHRLAEFLTSDSLTAQGYFEFEGFTGHLPMKRERPFQAWLQISVGCNCACSYCIVPSTRGREVSRPAAELRDEVARVAAEGVREVTLLGQNVCSYGRDLPKGEKTTFAELLATLDADRRHRSHPLHEPAPEGHPRGRDRALTRELAIGVRAHPPAAPVRLQPHPQGHAPHLHPRALPRPRGHDPRARAGRARSARTSSSASRARPTPTSRRRWRWWRPCATTRAFTFIFSPRRGTEAATLDGQVPHEVKRERMERLVEAVQRHATERAQRFVGRTMDVLVEGPSRTDPSRLRGPHAAQQDGALRRAGRSRAS